MKWYHWVGLGVAAVWLAERLIELYNYFTGLYAILWRMFWPWAKIIDPIVVAAQALFAPALLVLLILIHAKK